MTIDCSDITALAQNDFGTPVLIGPVQATGIFSAPGTTIERNGMALKITEPVLLVSDENAELVTNNSTELTINGVCYQCFAKTPDGLGFTELDLTRDY